MDDGKLSDAAWALDQERERRDPGNRRPANPNVVRSEREMNRGWMTTHPDLAVKNILELCDLHSDAFALSIDASRHDVITVIAKRKEKAADREGLDRATVQKVATGFSELQKLQQQHREKTAEMLRVCVHQLSSPNSAKRKEALAHLASLADILENSLI